MKLKIMLSCCLLLIAFLLPSNGQTCGSISTWADTDASFFVSLESPYVKKIQNTPAKSYQFGVPVTELTVYGNLNSWQISVISTSFETVAEAADALEKIRSGVYPEDIPDPQEAYGGARPVWYPVQPTIRNHTFLAGESQTVFWPISIAGSGIQSGTYELMVGVWDTEYGTIQVDVKDVQLCIPLGM